MKIPLRNIHFELSFWFFAIVALAVFAGADMVMLLFAVLIHEAGHAAAVVLSGGRITRIYAGMFGIRMYTRFGHYAGSRREILIWLSGPAAGMAAGLLALALSHWRFGAMNLLLSAFNLLPVEGLDGGGVMHELLCENFGSGGAALSHAVSLAALLVLLAAGGVVFLECGTEARAAHRCRLSAGERAAQALKEAVYLLKMKNPPVSAGIFCEQDRS